MIRKFSLFLFLAPLVASAQLEVGGGLLDNCKQIDALNDSGKFAEAKEKAQLCLQGIEQKLSGEISSYFYEEIAGWKRNRLEKNQAMGFSNVAATYRKGDIAVEVSLTASSGGSGGLGGFLGGLAQSGMMGGGQQVTVAGIPSTFSSDGTLMVPLKSGSFLTFESRDFSNADEAIAGMGDLINEFPVADINGKLE